MVLIDDRAAHSRRRARVEMGRYHLVSSPTVPASKNSAKQRGSPLLSVHSAFCEKAREMLRVACNTSVQQKNCGSGQTVICADGSLNYSVHLNLISFRFRLDFSCGRLRDTEAARIVAQNVTQLFSKRSKMEHKGQTGFGGSNAVTYLAFISYSSKDETIATSLHRALERTSHPGSSWWAPKKLRPIFRDRDELRAGSDVPRLIKEALSASSALIVVCSEHASISKWVNLEIEYFCSLGRRDRVFLFVGSSAPAEDGRLVPPILRDGVTPLFADARKGKDEWARAVAKIAAGLLNVAFDSIWKRHKRDNLRSLALKGVATSIVCLLTYVAYDQYVVSSSKRLAREAELMSEKTIDLALLLSVEAYGILPTEEARAAVENVLKFSPYLSAILYSVEPVTRVAFSPENDLIVSGDVTGALTFWDLKTSTKPGRRVQAHSAPITSLIFTGDGKRFISADHSKVSVWEQPYAKSTDIEIPKSDPKNDRICCVAIHPRNKTLAVGVSDNIFFWDLEKQQLLLPSIRAEDDITSLAFGRIVGGVLASGGEKNIQIWKMHDHSKHKDLPLYKNSDDEPEVSSMDFSKWGTLAAAWTDGKVDLWRVSDFTRREVALEGGVSRSTPVVRFNSKDEILAGSDRENGITLWNVAGRVDWAGKSYFTPGGIITRLRGPSTPVHDLTFSSDDNRLVASASGDRRIMIWTFDKEGSEQDTCLRAIAARAIAGRAMTSSERAQHMPLLPTFPLWFVRTTLRQDRC
jgi:WD40 repeat protein